MCHYITAADGLHPLIHPADDISTLEFEMLEKELSVSLKKDGEIFVSKDSGLFKALK